MLASIPELPHASIERGRVEEKRKQELDRARRRLARRLRLRQRGFAIDGSITDSLERKLERLQNGVPTFEEQTRHFIKRTLCQLLVAAALTGSIAYYDGYFDRLAGPRYIVFNGPGFTIVGCKERERVSCEKNPQDREGKVLNVKNLVAFEAQVQGVPIDLALAVAEQESGFTCNVISIADAMGVLQILYPTAVEMGFRGKPEELLRCHNSTRYGMKYLKYVLDEAGGDICLAANKYFAGVHAGFIASGEKYCRGVLDKMQHYKNANIARL